MNEMIDDQLIINISNPFKDLFIDEYTIFDPLEYVEQKEIYYGVLEAFENLDIRDKFIISKVIATGYDFFTIIKSLDNDDETMKSQILKLYQKWCVEYAYLYKFKEID